MVLLDNDGVRISSFVQLLMAILLSMKPVCLIFVVVLF